MAYSIYSLPSLFTSLFTSTSLCMPSVRALSRDIQTAIPCERQLSDPTFNTTRSPNSISPQQHLPTPIPIIPLLIPNPYETNLLKQLYTAYISFLHDCINRLPLLLP